MSGPRIATIVNFAARIAYGAVMLQTPARVGKPWLGDVADGAPTKIPLRGIGGREVALHAVGIAALLNGSPIRPWCLAGIAGDLTDVASTYAARKELPAGALRATVLTGGGSALWTAVLIATADDD